MNNSKWINNFKVAILTKNIPSILGLIEAFPSLELEKLSIKKEVLAYLRQAKYILSTTNKKIRIDMNHIELQKKLNQALKTSSGNFTSKYI